MVRYTWRSLYDQSIDRSYIILPRTGYLISTDDERALIDHPLRSRLFGLHVGRGREDEDFRQGAHFSCDLPSIPLEDPRVARTIQRYVRATLAWLPLSLAIQVLSRLFPARKPVDTFEAAFAEVRDRLGTPNDDQCLSRTLCRFLLFRRLGYETVINVGAFIPTEEMHAWLDRNQQPILEDPDRLAHYQALLRYSAP